MMKDVQPEFTCNITDLGWISLHCYSNRRYNFSQSIIDHYNWNKLPYEIVNTPSVFLFKTKLFNIYNYVLRLCLPFHTN